MSFEDCESLTSSPRSLETCARLGIQPKELIHRPPSYYRKIAGNVPDEILQLYYKHFEQKRNTLIRRFMKEYTKVKKEFSFQMSKTTESSVRHESFERRSNLRKSLQELKVKALKIWKKEHDKACKALDNTRTRKEVETDTKNALLSAARIEKAKIKEIDKQKKIEKLTKRNELRQNKLRDELDKKKKEMETRDKARIQDRKRKYLQKQTENQEIQKKRAEKLANAQTKMEELLEKRKQDMIAKFAESERRRKEFDKAREEANLKHKVLSQKHAQRLEEMLKIKEERAEERKQIFLKTIQKAEQKKAWLDKLAEENRQLRKNTEIEEEKKRVQKRNKLERIEEKNRNEITKRLKEDDEKVKKQREKHEKELKIKQEINKIKMLDKVQEIERVERVREYQRKKFLDKIMIDDQKSQRAYEHRDKKHDLLTFRSLSTKSRKTKPKLDIDFLRNKIEEEQSKEDSRKSLLKQTLNPKEIKRLEKIFALERKKASTRILRLIKECDN